ncbi:MAG TPA: FMN-dependent NADH-azoreductase [Verrucomicrobiae bacterium]|jgi:FMN-dependent NADH-azoreductase|nr:FMN-dependent NADH-azoreductase [Verrucomicrobiae bacterium]
MSKLLFVSSSILGENSKSRALGLDFIETWKRRHPGTAVVERDLVAETLPHVTGAVLGAALTPAEKRSPEQAETAALADRLIEEIEAADVILLAVPMYNFSVPSTFKAWIDHIVRAGRTFRYGAEGPVGLLQNKKVFVVASRGGVYSSGAGKSMDFHEPYLRGVLGFIGLKDVTFIYAEGLNISPETAAGALDGARATIAELFPKAA